MTLTSPPYTRNTRRLLLPPHTVTRPRSLDTRHQSEMVITPPPVKWSLVTVSNTQPRGPAPEQHKDTLPTFLGVVVLEAEINETWFEDIQ